MNKPNLAQFAQRVETTLTKHSPAILTGLGITGFWVAIGFAVTATPKALIKIQDAEIEKTDRQVLEGKSPDEISSKLTPLEVVKASWKCYIPAAVTAGLSTACLIGASSVNLKRNAALATAYTLSETALREYQEKVVETIGEKKEQVVRDAIAKDKITKNPVENHEIIITGTGNQRCYDAISGRYFESNVQTIRTAESTMNKRLISEMYVSLNEFYLELGLPCTDLGEQLGWKIENGGVDLTLSSHVCDDGVVALVIDYRIAPKYCYGR